MILLLSRIHSAILDPVLALPPRPRRHRDARVRRLYTHTHTHMHTYGHVDVHERFHLRQEESFSRSFAFPRRGGIIHRVP